MNVADIMSRGVECLSPGESIAHAALRMRDLDVGSLPVCGDGDKLVGIITDRDITIRAIANGCDPGGTFVGDVMTPGIIYCFEADSVEDAAKKMEAEQIRRLPVLNKDKRLVGIVSLGDLAVRGRDEQLSGEALEQVSEPVVAC